MTREAREHSVTWMQKVGVILVVGMLLFFGSMILLNAFDVIDEDVSAYESAMVITIIVVAVGLFASSIKNWPAWSLG